MAHFEGCAALKCMHYRHISGAWKANSLWKCLVYCSSQGPWSGLFVTSVLCLWRTKAANQGNHRAWQRSMEQYHLTAPLSDIWIRLIKMSISSREASLTSRSGREQELLPKRCREIYILSGCPFNEALIGVQISIKPLEQMLFPTLAAYSQINWSI